MPWIQKIKCLVLIACCVLSCTRIIEVPLPPHEPTLVLHGYVITGEKFHVTINQTARANSPMNGDETLVSDAWVLLYEDNSFVDSLRYDTQTKRYTSQNVAAVPGKTYKVVAGAAGFTTIEASSRATLPVNIVSLAREVKARSNTNSELLDDIFFTFNDVAGEKNFYLAALYDSEYGRGFLSCVYSNDPAIDRIRGQVLPFEEDVCIDHEEILFSDKSFNGTLKQISISASSEALISGVDSNGNVHRPYLKRSAISEEHYQYLKSTLSLYQDGAIPSLHEPVAVKGNVKNGYGLLSVYSVSTDTLR